jgi:predicted transcriptional regulator
MLVPQIDGLGLAIMETLWRDGPASIRAVHDALPPDERPKINTTRAAFHRLLHNGYVRRLKQVSHSAVFEAVVARDQLVDAAADAFADIFKDNMGEVIARLIETGRLARADIETLDRARDRD